MTKKDFVALADMLMENDLFGYDQISSLADYCKSRNSRFNRELWLDYIAGKRGPNGEKVTG